MGYEEIFREESFMSLKINFENNILKIDGTDKLRKRTKFSLKNIIGGEFTQNSIIVNDFHNIQELIEFLDDEQIEYSLDDYIRTEYQNELDDINNFKLFSEEARKIWYADYNSTEFQEFTNILSKKMDRKLYKLQLLSAYHLSFSQNACNFSVPGAGKTSIVYGAYTYLKNSDDYSKKVDKLLIVGPLSSFKAWEDEYFSCFSRTPTSTRIPDLNSLEKSRYFFSDNTSEITLISYQSLINQVDNIIHFLKNNNVMVILDEAHKIKNTENGKFSSSSLSLASFSKSRVILTGTPAPNGYRDLYNLFEFIWPEKKIIKYSPLQLEDMTKNSNDRRVEDLIDALLPYFVRIKKSDLNLPAAIDNPPNFIPMDSIQSDIYQLISDKMIRDLKKEEEEMSVIGAFKKAKLVRLQQAASNPHLLLKPLEDPDLDFDIFDNYDEELMFHLESISSDYIPQKFYYALDIIKDKIKNNEKVIVWTIFVDTLKRFNNFLLENGINSKYIYGETPTLKNDDVIQTREDIIEEFKNSNLSVLVTNPAVLGESVSLHKSCHNAIYLERDFDAGKFVQSKDRIHRYGLDSNVITNYYYPITKDTIEVAIAERLIEKEKLMDYVSESREIPLFNTIETGLIKEDIIEVIKSYESN